MAARRAGFSKSMEGSMNTPTDDVRGHGEDGLLPCPFCGGTAKRLTLGPDDGPDNDGGNVIVCTGVCGASSHVEFGRKENLLSLWNTRATPIQPERGMVEALHALEQAEMTYRAAHDLFGDGSRECGRAWDLMRRAGDAARAALSSPDSKGEGR